MTSNDEEWTGSNFQPSEVDLEVYRRVQASGEREPERIRRRLVETYAYDFSQSVPAETHEWSHIIVPDIAHADGFDEVRQEVMAHGGVHPSIQIAFPVPARPDWAAFSCGECSWTRQGLYRRTALEADPELEGDLPLNSN
jgi:hypothetical protein